MSHGQNVHTIGVNGIKQIVDAECHLPNFPASGGRIEDDGVPLGKDFERLDCRLESVPPVHGSLRGILANLEICCFDVAAGLPRKMNLTTHIFASAHRRIRRPPESVRLRRRQFLVVRRRESLPPIRHLAPTWHRRCRSALRHRNLAIHRNKRARLVRQQSQLHVLASSDDRITYNKYISSRGRIQSRQM